MKRRIACLLLSLSVVTAVSAQSLSEKYARQLTRPKGYVAYKAAEPLVIDGVMDEASWKSAPATDAFVDICGDGFPTPRFHTDARMLWDDSCLYVAARLEEPDLWADLTKRDEVVWHDPDFEVFIDPQGCAHSYFEIEVNCIGTVFDLSLENAYRAKIRPFIQFQYNTPGLRVAIQREGTVNNPADRDKGWTVEMAIPRTAIAAEFDNYLQAGHYLRINFSRVEWQVETDADGRYVKKKDAAGKQLSEDNWVWSPTGAVAMHMPERWGYVYLSPMTAGQGTDAFVYPADDPLRRFLWMLFYEQESQFAAHKRYLSRLSAFHLTRQDRSLLPKGSKVTIETTSHTYEITLTTPDNRHLVINEDGRCFYRE